MGLIPSRSGAILLEGTRLEPDIGSRTSQQRRQISLLFQNPDAPLIPGAPLPAYDRMRYDHSLLSVARNQKRVSARLR